MNVLTQNVLDDLVFNLKHIKYKNIIQDLKLEYCTDNNGEYIYLVLINIKKSQRETGYGNKILKETIDIANFHNVRIRLWATDGYGSQLKRLYNFYKRHGFKKISNDIKGHMVYYPTKTKNKIIKLGINCN